MQSRQRSPMGEGWWAGPRGTDQRRSGLHRPPEALTLGLSQPPTPTGAGSLLGVSEKHEQLLWRPSR